MRTQARVRRDDVRVTVYIDPDDLEAEGWVFGEGGMADAVETLANLRDVIEATHYAEHDGALHWCSHPLCKTSTPT